MQNQFSDLGISLHLQGLPKWKLWSQQRFSKNHSVIAVQHYRCSGISQNWNRKTAALIAYFTINRYECYSAVQAVILVPTRELGHQILEI
jgi:hypothetical protein